MGRAGAGEPLFVAEEEEGNKQWVRLALDADTREIVGVYIGNRDEAAAGKLWDCLPSVYCQWAVAYTDFWAAYGAVFPSKRHQAVGKETGLTSYIVRASVAKQNSSIHHYNALLLLQHYVF